jgi:hypothetical protein
MFRVLAVALALAVGGCAIAHQELNNRGGYVDYLADKYWWKADSKKMRALRAYALHTAIARIAMISPKGAPQRNQLAYQIGTAGTYAKLLVACAYDSIDEPCFYFDSIMVDYVAALYDAAIAALPLEDARKLVNDLTGGIAGPAAAVDALHALIQLGTDAVRYGTISAALYRDSLELEVQVWIYSPFEPGSRVTLQDVATLTAIYAAGNDDIPAWKAEIERLLNLGLEPTPSRRFFARLFKLMAYACVQITQDRLFQQQCIVDPGTTTLSRSQVTQRKQEKQDHGGNQVDQNQGTQSHAGSQADHPNKTQPTDQDSLKAQLMAITKEIATKEKLRQNMRAIAPTDSGVKAEIERRIADLQTEIDALKEKARALEKQIGELQK